MITGRRLLRGVLAATALGCAAVGLVLGLMIVLPTPNLGLRLGEARSLDATGDVKCALGSVKENAGRYGVDPDRIALMGRSAGGLFALLAAYTQGDPRLPPSCGVRDTGVEAMAAFYSPTDLTRFDEIQWPWWRSNLSSPVKYSTGFTPESEPERRLASPISHVDPGDPPTFLTHGGRDQWAPPEQSVLSYGHSASVTPTPHHLHS